MGYSRFEDLRVWQKAREFRKRTIDSVEKFPKIETYALGMQLRRASYSITANIAEGHGRFHFQENIQALRIARGSLNECIDHLYTALDQRYIDKMFFDEVYKIGRDLELMLNSFIAKLEKRVEELR